MYCKTIVCALALIQSISAQAIGLFNGLAEPFGLPYGPCGAYAEAAVAPYGMGPYVEAPFAPYNMFTEPWITPFGTCGFGLGPGSLAASNGAGLTVTSMSPVAPTGVTLITETAFEGPLAIAGAIPFLGAVNLEGALPTLGAGAVNYACGDGAFGMISEDFTPAGLGPLAYDGLIGPYVYDRLIGPYGYDGLIGPYGYDGLIGPYGYDGLIGAYGYDGLVGPRGYDGIMGPYGRFGLYGYNGVYY